MELVQLYCIIYFASRIQVPLAWWQLALAPFWLGWHMWSPYLATNTQTFSNVPSMISLITEINITVPFISDKVKWAIRLYNNLWGFYTRKSIWLLLTKSAELYLTTGIWGRVPCISDCLPLQKILYLQEFKIVMVGVFGSLCHMLNPVPSELHNGEP